MHRQLHGVRFASPEDRIAVAERTADLALAQSLLISAPELHQAKALLLRQIPLSESSEESVAAGLLGRAEIGLPLDESFRAAQKYFGMTAAEVKDAFARKISTANLVQVVRGPAPQ